MVKSYYKNKMGKWQEAKQSLQYGILSALCMDIVLPIRLIVTVVGCCYWLMANGSGSG